jgi:hypothetical protein
VPTSRLGIRLILLVGDTVPLPPPPGVADALRTAEVTCDAAGEDGFQLTFALAQGTGADYPLVGAGTFAPFRRVCLGILMGALPEVLIDGIVTHQQLSPGREPGSATLTVTGKDLGTMMDL